VSTVPAGISWRARRQGMSERFRFARTARGRVGLTLLVLIVAIAVFGPLFAPHNPDAQVGIPFAGPSSRALLGTDALGRDVLSRVLYGGRTVLLYPAAAAVLAYLIGGAVGLFAGYNRGRSDGLLMRGVDVLLSFPSLVFLLVLVTGLGTSAWVLIVGTAVVQAPMVARIVRSATLEQVVRGFVEAAVARGDSTLAILRREVLPNIVPAVMADAGLRFTYSLLLIASVNFLGLGLQPPAADWGLMVSENRTGIAIMPLGVVVPAVLIALLTISLNLIGDAISQSLGRSSYGDAK
jgi:peptide/nickel transport system permease protein